MEIVYWHWIVLGVALMLFEIVMTTFFIIWFGVAALIMGLVLLLNGDITLGWQVFIWTLLSVILAVAWFRYLKPLSIDRTKAGLSREAIVGETGQVIRAPGEEQRAVRHRVELGLRETVEEAVVGGILAAEVH